MTTMARMGGTVASAAALVLGCAATAGAATAPPYQQSRLITGITWNQATHRWGGLGGDLWASTSGANGEVYTAWGDGFGGCPAYVSYGTAVVTGGPGTNLVGTG